MRPTLRSVILAFLLSVSLHSAYADLGCPPAIKTAPTSFPLDYNDPDNRGHILYLVEMAHFTPAVETLQHGNTATIGGDLNYVLEAFPNHPRALNAMARLTEIEHIQQPRGAHYSIECYFHRAMDFAPSDPTPPMLYAIYLANHDKDQEALQNYQLSEKIEPDNPNLQYNMGLLYFKMKEYDKSLDYAHKAYDGGFPLPGLRQKLQKAGVWKNE